MFKPKYKKDQNKVERAIWNYDRRNYRSEQAKFERECILSCSGLGFTDVESITENVIDRLNPKTSHNHNHRPNLFDDSHLIGIVRHIGTSVHRGLSE